MIPTNVLLDAIATRIASDAGTLAHATDGVLLHLAKAVFNPGPTLVVGDFTEADFDGYAALEAGAGAQQFFVDPISTERTIQVLEPAGGWHFETTGVTNLPQTIRGAYLTNNAGTVLYGSVLFDDPVVLTAANEAVDVSNVRFRLHNDLIR